MWVGLLRPVGKKTCRIYGLDNISQQWLSTHSMINITSTSRKPKPSSTKYGSWIIREETELFLSSMKREDSQIFRSRKLIIHSIRQHQRSSQNDSATYGSLKGLFPCYLPLLALLYAPHTTCTISYKKSCTTPCYITSYHKLSSYPPTLPNATLITHNYVIYPICPHGYSLYTSRPCR